MTDLKLVAKNEQININPDTSTKRIEPFVRGVENFCAKCGYAAPEGLRGFFQAWHHKGHDLQHCYDLLTSAIRGNRTIQSALDEIAARYQVPTPPEVDEPTPAAPELPDEHGGKRAEAPAASPESGIRIAPVTYNDMRAWAKQVMNDAKLPEGAVKVAIAILLWMTFKTGEAIVRVGNIADVAGVDRSTVFRNIKLLEARGHLDVHRRSGVKSRFHLLLRPVAELCDPSQKRATPRRNTPSHPSHGSATQPVAELRDPIESLSDSPEKKRETLTQTRAGSNSKELPKDWESDEQFKEWYAQYPKRVAPADAHKLYRKVVDGGKASPEELRAGAMRYAVSRQGQDPKFTKHPATWLNKECWHDDSAPPPNGPPRADPARSSPLTGAASAVDGIWDWVKRTEECS